MLEILPDDRPDANPLADAGDAGPERADAANDQVDLDTCLAGRIERADAGRVHERVQLQDDVRRAAGPGVVRLALDHLQDPVAQVHRRHDEAPEIALARQACEHVEQVAHVRAKFRAAREKAEVRVQAGGAGVVVAGPDVDVAPQR